jgi:hypothetical protein
MGGRRMKWVDNWQGKIGKKRNGRRRKRRDIRWNI